MSEEIQDVMSDKNNVLVIEWGGLVEGKLPLGRVLINIDKDPKDQNSRLINFHIPGRFKYLAGNLQPRIDT